MLHQGPGAWTIPTLVDLCELPPELAKLVSPFVPRFDVALLDLARWTPRRLRSLPPGLARLGLAVMRAARRDDEDLVAIFGRWREDVRRASAVRPRTFRALVSYTAWVRGEQPDARYLDEVRRAIHPADREAVMSGFVLFDDLMRDKHRAEGEREATRRILERLLRRRFPHLTGEHLARLEGASMQELERWTEQVVVAPTLDAVFADEA